MNGFGLNAAVQAFPSAYEFGRSLVGQDRESLAQAFKEKLMSQEMAQNQQKIDDEAAYRAEQARIQDYAGQTDRMNAMGLQAVRDQAIRHADRKLPYELKSLGVNNAYTQEKTRDLSEMRPYEQRGKDASAAYMSSMGGYQKAKTDEQEFVNQENQAERDYDDAMTRLAVDPFAEGVSDAHRQRFMTESGMMANPNAGRALALLDAATAQFQKTGDRALFNDELKQATGAALQPLVDQNTSAAPGSYRFGGFDQVPGGVTMRLKRVDPGSGQPVSTEPLYVTNGRVPMANGGVPTVFSPQDIRQVMAGLRAADDWQKANPEMSRRLQNMAIAHGGARDRSTYAKNLAMLEKADMASVKDAGKQAQLEDKHKESMRKALISDVMADADKRASFNEKDFVTEDDMGKSRNTPAIQRVMAARQRIKAEIESALQKGNLEDLAGITPGEIAQHSKIRALVDEYIRLSRGVGVAGANYAPPTSGAIQNDPTYGSR